MLVNTITFYKEYNYIIVKNNIYGTVTNKNAHLKELILKSSSKRVAAFNTISEDIQYLFIYNNNIQLYNDFYNTASSSLIKMLYYNSFFFLQKQKNLLKQNIRAFLFLRSTFFYLLKKKVSDLFVQRNTGKKNFYFIDNFRINYKNNILSFKYFQNILNKLLANKYFIFYKGFYSVKLRRKKLINLNKRAMAKQFFTFFFSLKGFFLKKIFWKIMFLQKKNVFFLAHKSFSPIKFKKSKQFLNGDVDALLRIDYIYPHLFLDLFLFRYFYILLKNK